jgi:hypothetical protein
MYNFRDCHIFILPKTLNSTKQSKKSKEPKEGLNSEIRGLHTESTSDGVVRGPDRRFEIEAQPQIGAFLGSLRSRVGIPIR